MAEPSKIRPYLSPKSEGTSEIIEKRLKFDGNV